MFDYLDPSACCRMDGERPTLPLDVMSIILSYIESPADLARIGRISRIYHFITIPYLYSTVVLCPVRHPPTPSAGPSLSQRRHSPFLAALATLQKPATAACVKRLIVKGELNSHAQSHYWQNGLWSDYEGGIALSIAGVLPGMTGLVDFVWDVSDTYVHPFLYVALSRHPTLERFEVKYPNPLEMPDMQRPPATSVPPFRSLKKLRLLGLAGPLYADDIVLMVIASPHFESIRVAWRPESMLSQMQFLELMRKFSQRFGMKQGLKLRDVGLSGAIIDKPDALDTTFVTETITSLTLWDCIIPPEAWRGLFQRPYYLATKKVLSQASTPVSTPGTHHSSTSTSSSRTASARLPLKKFSTNTVTDQYIHIIENATSTIEELYFIDNPDNFLPGSESLKPRALAAIHQMGPNLRKLRLAHAWVLTREEATRLIRACPNLEELALAMGFYEWELLRFLIPFLPHLRALFMLDGGPNAKFAKMLPLPVSSGSFFEQQDEMEACLGELELSHLRWIALGPCVFHIEHHVRIREDGRPSRAVAHMDIAQAMKGRGAGVGILDCLNGLESSW
ncbi:hypothetical protein EDC01DRAFT_608787 [Geopyxis carbonaria]|nr:hypothetical protein EDC01DRAFT_608787 [Geopyxis carbonaria]